MDYNEILEEIKALFIEKLEKIVETEAYEANPLLSKHTYLNTLYTDIMALGYNFGDLKKATDDIYEMQAALHDESQEFYRFIEMRVEETAALYPGLVIIFSEFHTATQAGKAFERVLIDVKSALNVQNTQNI